MDAQGNILNRAGLTGSANSDPDASESFAVTLVVPASTSSMAFSYQGLARESSEDGGASSFFWHYPINRLPELP